MTKKLCKSVRRAGSPCQGQGLDQFDGYRIAHGPVAKTREWRKRGGVNASTAARAGKRIPERLRRAIETLDQGLLDVREGKPEPAAYSAICRGVRAMVDLYRLADQEMEQIRNEEAEAVALELAGAHGDPAILAASARFAEEQDQYRIEAFIIQGLVTPVRTGNRNEPPQYVLTEKGRRRFGIQQGSSYAQADIDQIEEILNSPIVTGLQCAFALKELTDMRTSMEDAIAGLTREPEPVRDPITGVILNEPPAGVNIGTWYPNEHIEPKAARKILQDQLQQVIRLARIFEAGHRRELASPYS